MKALSLWQPWATLVAIGAKRIETRSWPTDHRGLIAIHATKQGPPEGDILLGQEPFASVLAQHRILALSDLPRGSIVAVARVIACESIAVAQSWRYLPRWWPAEGSPERAFGNYEGARYAWLLEDVQPLAEPIPCRGMQGLWTVPDDVLELVERQLQGRS